MADKPSVSHESRATLKFGHQVEASDVKAFLERVPDAAMLTITRYEGDAREPSETTISATWDPTREGEYGQ